MLLPLQQHLATFAWDVYRLCVWLVLLTTVFVTLERLFALRRERVFRLGFATDIAYYFLTSLLPGVLLAAPLALVAWAAHHVVPGEWYAAIAGWPLAARVAATLVVGEVGFYWGHRWSHELPLLWRFHAIHHSAEHIDWLVNTRAHPVDLVFGRLCGLVPIYLVGLGGPAGSGGSMAPVILILTGTVWGFFIHANVRWRFGWLEWVVATPAFHHWHHTNDTENRDRNYASMLPMLDRVFGTLHLPRRLWPAEYGVDRPVGSTLARQLIDPLIQRR